MRIGRLAELSTTFVEQERIAPEIVKLFGKVPSDLIPSKDALLTLQSCIDSAVHFYFYLTERLEVPLDPYDKVTDDVVGDLVAYIEYFWRVRISSRELVRDQVKRFQWKTVSSPKELKRKFIASYKKLIHKRLGWRIATII